MIHKLETSKKMPTPSMKPRKREAAAVDVRTTMGWVLRTKGAAIMMSSRNQHN